jgi:integrase
MNLNARTVAALRMPTGKTDVIYFDDALPGFGYRLRAGAGNKVLRSWVAQYRRTGGSRRVLLGNAAALSAEQARAAAKKVLAAAALGQDPQADRRERRDKDRHTLRSVATEYLQAKKSELRPRSYVESERYLLTGKYFKPLHTLAINAVSRADVSSRILAIAREAGNTTANRARSNLNALFSWSIRMGLTDSNPVVNSVQAKESEGRTRVLSDSELAAIWRACGDDGDYSRIVRLLILLACRRQEIGSMQWPELDPERGLWAIPPERSKNGREHMLPLPLAAWAIIDGVPHIANRDYLFGTRAQGFKQWAHGKTALGEALGDTVASFVLHDIRRTVATKMADLGIQPHVIEQILNHQSGHRRGVAGIYNRSSYEREVKAALALWADHVRSLVNGGEHKIVALPMVRA